MRQLLRLSLAASQTTPQTAFLAASQAAFLVPCRRYGARRVRLTSKMGNKEYYKGSGSGSAGRLTSTGHFVPDVDKIRQWRIPSLTDTALRPYVARTTRPLSGGGEGVPRVPRDIKSFMELALANDGQSL